MFDRSAQVTGLFAATGVILGCLVAGTEGWCQTSTPPPAVAKAYMNKNVILLPIHISGHATLKRIDLYVKKAPEGPWKKASSANPSQEQFIFRVPADGEYWFTIVAVDYAGKGERVDTSQLKPQQIVVVDQVPPEIDIRCLASKSVGQCVQCTIRDANPDWNSLDFYFQTGDGKWRRLEPEPGKRDTYCIPPQARFTGMLRATARDICGNVTERKVHIRDCPAAVEPVAPIAAAPQSPQTRPVIATRHEQSVPPTPPESAVELPPPYLPTPPNTPVTVPVVAEKPAAYPQPAALPEQPAASPLPRQTKTTRSRRLVRDPKILLNYRVEKQGPSGLGRVEIWITHDDGANWLRLAEDPDRRSPAEIVLPGEGTYGLRLVASNAYGFGGEPPKTGDRPEWVVEVDSTPPQARLLSVDPLKGAEAGSVLIRWIASDKNLGVAPIRIEYAVDPKGPWQPVATDVKNTGQHVWRVPPAARRQCYLRLTVTDEAGNRSVAYNAGPIRLDDFSRPVVRIQDIQPVTAGNAKR